MTGIDVDMDSYDTIIIKKNGIAVAWINMNPTYIHVNLDGALFVKDETHDPFENVWKGGCWDLKAQPYTPEDEDTCVECDGTVGDDDQYCRHCGACLVNSLGDRL